MRSVVMNGKKPTQYGDEHKNKQALTQCLWWWTQKQTSANTMLAPQHGDEHKNKQVHSVVMNPKTNTNTMHGDKCKDSMVTNAKTNKY